MSPTSNSGLKLEFFLIKIFLGNFAKWNLVIAIFRISGTLSPFEPPESAALEINQIHKILHFHNFLITINVVLSDEIYFLVRIWTKDGKDFFREIRIDSQSTPAVTWSRRFLIICAESDVLLYDLKLLDDIKWRTEGKIWKKF